MQAHSSSTHANCSNFYSHAGHSWYLVAGLCCWNRPPEVFAPTQAAAGYGAAREPGTGLRWLGEKTCSCYSRKLLLGSGWPGHMHNQSTAPGQIQPIVWTPCICVFRCAAQPLQCCATAAWNNFARPDCGSWRCASRLLYCSAKFLEAVVVHPTGIYLQTLDLEHHHPVFLSLGHVQLASGRSVPTEKVCMQLGP